MEEAYWTNMDTANTIKNTGWRPWQPGESGNPSGRPKGTRDLAHLVLAGTGNGEELVAMTANGRSLAGVLDDLAGRRLSNEAMMFGARAAGISGSGPAIAVFIPSVSTPTIERLQNLYEKDDDIEKVIFTKVKNPKIEKHEETT